MQQIQFSDEQTSHWAGMDDFLLISPDGEHRIALCYAGEPPHGDSYHNVAIDDRPFPGFAWTRSDPKQLDIPITIGRMSPWGFQSW